MTYDYKRARYNISIATYTYTQIKKLILDLVLSFLIFLIMVCISYPPHSVDEDGFHNF